MESISLEEKQTGMSLQQGRSHSTAPFSRHVKWETVGLSLNDSILVLQSSNIMLSEVYVSIFTIKRCESFYSSPTSATLHSEAKSVSQHKEAACIDMWLTVYQTPATSRAQSQFCGFKHVVITGKKLSQLTHSVIFVIPVCIQLFIHPKASRSCQHNALMSTQQQKWFSNAIIHLKDLWEPCVNKGVLRSAVAEIFPHFSTWCCAAFFTLSWEQCW